MRRDGREKGEGFAAKNSLHVVDLLLFGFRGAPYRRLAVAYVRVG